MVGKMKHYSDLLELPLKTY